MLAAMNPDPLKQLKATIRLGVSEPPTTSRSSSFLASDRARYVTAQVIQVDGGLVL